jgi:hypothetical protein
MSFDSKEEARRHVFTYGAKIMDQEHKVLSAAKLLFGDEVGSSKKAAEETPSVKSPSGDFMRDYRVFGA